MLTKRWEIHCDQRGCFIVLTSLFKSDLKAKAKGLGWVKTRGLLGSATHTCPACQAKAKNAETGAG
jgi:hypothetical protein